MLEQLIREFGILDLVDILLVSVLLYQVFKLLRGTLAINIFIGLILLYVISVVVKALDMKLLSNILGQFMGVGFIALLIVFQPEIRRFLLFLGKRINLGRIEVFKRIGRRATQEGIAEPQIKTDILKAVEELASEKTGALIVLADNSEKILYEDTGVKMDAKVSRKLILSIFNKTSPLHDGAVVISNGKITVAGAVLPVSENQDLPSGVGLRHRAAVGATEEADVRVIVVSEETGKISYAKDRQLAMNLSPKAIGNILDVVLLEKV